jgi:hypothetical protein
MHADDSHETTAIRCHSTRSRLRQQQQQQQPVRLRRWLIIVNEATAEWTNETRNFWPPFAFNILFYTDDEVSLQAVTMRSYGGIRTGNKRGTKHNVNIMSRFAPAPIGAAAIAFVLLSAVSTVVFASSDEDNDQLPRSFEKHFMNDLKDTTERSDAGHVIVVLQALDQNAERLNDGDERHERLGSVANGVTGSPSTLTAAASGKVINFTC